MVGASERPITGVEKGLVVNVRCCATILLKRLREAGAPIRVHHGVNHHNHIIEHRRYFGVCARYEVVDARQCRIRARRLVAMNRVSHPRHGGKGLDDGISFTIV